MKIKIVGTYTIKGKRSHEGGEARGVGAHLDVRYREEEHKIDATIRVGGCCTKDSKEEPKG